MVVLRQWLEPIGSQRKLTMDVSSCSMRRLRRARSIAAYHKPHPRFLSQFQSSHTKLTSKPALVMALTIAAWMHLILRIRDSVDSQSKQDLTLGEERRGMHQVLAFATVTLHSSFAANHKLQYLKPQSVEMGTQLSLIRVVWSIRSCQ